MKTNVRGNERWGGWVAGVALLAAACGGEDRVQVQPEDAEAILEQSPDDAPFYDFSHRVEIEVELSPADWQSLRNEGRGLGVLFSPDLPFEYTRFSGAVSIDGQRYEQVQIRKKGFLGSLSALRPSIKLDLAEVLPGQSHLGVRRVTLNNDRQDPSHTHQCMAYHAFARAGLVAPRCNLAHVVVNGEDLGTFSNVEPIDKRLLRRHFSSDEGNLYEAQATDVVDTGASRMQAKTNEVNADRSDLEALAAALEASDADLVEQLGRQLDLDQFRSFWAAETLLGHWDGYAGNTNNYFVYRDPGSQRFTFMPWGMDSAFEGINPFDSINRDVTVYAAGRIANRLYALPAERELFRARLGELEQSQWDEALLLAEVDQIEALAPDAAPLALAAQRSHIETHGDLLRAALAEPARDWQDAGGLFASPCLGQSGAVRGEFSTSFGSLEMPAPGPVLELSLDGAPVELTWLGRAGLDPATGSPDPRVRYLGPLADGRFVVVDFIVPATTFSSGARPFHGLETFGSVVVVGSDGPRLVGVIGDGAINLRQASSDAGAPVSGDLEGVLLQFGCAEL
jgi:hypothetical protein